MNADELRARLAAGEWLRTGEVAVLFGTRRSTVDGWLRRGRLRFRTHPVSGYRTCDPDDVQRLLAQATADAPAPAADED